MRSVSNPAPSMGKEIAWCRGWRAPFLKWSSVEMVRLQTPLQVFCMLRGMKVGPPLQMQSSEGVVDLFAGGLLLIRSKIIG